MIYPLILAAVGADLASSQAHELTIPPPENSSAGDIYGSAGISTSCTHNGASKLKLVPWNQEREWQKMGSRSSLKRAAEELKGQGATDTVVFTPPLGAKGEVRFFLLQFLQGNIRRGYYFHSRIVARCTTGGVYEGCGELNFATDSPDSPDSPHSLAIAYPKQIEVWQHNGEIIVKAYGGDASARLGRSMDMYRYSKSVGFEHLCRL